MFVRTLRTIAILFATICSLEACKSDIQKCDEVVAAAKTLSMIPVACWGNDHLDSLRNANALIDSESKDSVIAGFESLLYQSDRWKTDAEFDSILNHGLSRLIEVDPLNSMLPAYLLQRWDYGDGRENLVFTSLVAVTRALEKQFYLDSAKYRTLQIRDSAYVAAWEQYDRSMNIIDIHERIAPLSDELNRWKVERARAVVQITLTCPEKEKLNFRKTGMAMEAYLDFLENNRTVEATKFAKQVGYSDSTITRIRNEGRKGIIP